MTDHKQRIPGLDLLRAIAIISVLIAHTITPAMFGRFYNYVIFSGFFGVELFFVLSGFLIGTVIIKTHNYEPVTSVKSIRTFWIRRWFRTLPNYYLVILIYNLIAYKVSHQFIYTWSNNALYFVFLQNAFEPINNAYFAVSWSLTVEEWFYLLFPLLLFFMQLLIKSKPGSLLMVISVFICIPLFLRVYMAVNNYYPDWDAGYRKLMPVRLDAIGVGVLLSYFHYYYTDALRKLKNKLSILGVLSLVFLILYLFFSYLVVSDHVNVFLRRTIFFTLFSIALALILPKFYYLKISSHRYFAPITFISLISYSVYLLHPIIGVVLFNVLNKRQITNPYIHMVLVWILTFIISWVVYRFFEHPMTNLRDRFRGKKFTVTS